MNDALAAWVVAAARLTPTLVLLPPLSWWGMPLWMRLAVAAAMSAAAAPLVQARGGFSTAALTGDVGAGLALALIVSLPLWSLQVAGAVAGAISGWGDGERGALPDGAFVFGMAVVAAGHGHTWIVAGLLRSLRAWPAGAWGLQGEVIAAAGEMLGAAVMMALPAVAICGLAHAAMAVAGRLAVVPAGLPVRPVAAIVGALAMVPFLAAGAEREVAAIVAFLAGGK